MICELVKGLIAGAWADDLTADEEIKLREHLSTCAECSAEMTEYQITWERLGDMPVPEPSPAMTARWEATFATLLSASPKPTRRLPMWQLAIAASLLLGGVLLGGLWHRAGNSNSEVERLRQEIAGTRTMVAVSLLQQQSAVDRLRGVNYTQGMSNMSPEVVSALVKAVNHDPNVNVRLAAIDALGKLSSDRQVGQSMADSLGQQQSPMVQAALIDYLVDSRNRGATDVLHQLVSRTDLNPSIRERATSAAQQLTQYK